MKYLLLFALCISLSKINFAQQKNPENYKFQYFIKVNGVHTKQTVKSFIEIINTNKKIKSVRAFGITKDNFLLSTNEEISNVEISNLLQKTNFVVNEFLKGPFSSAFFKKEKLKTTSEKKIN